MQLIKKISLKGLFCFVILPIFLSLFSLPKTETREININKEDFPYILNYDWGNNKDEHSLKYVFLKMLDSTLKLEFYNICLNNDSYIEKNGKIILRDDLVPPMGNLSVDVYPLAENFKIYNYFQFLKYRNKDFIDYSGKGLEYSKTLISEPGKTRCLKQLTDEDGFLFTGIKIKTLGATWIGIKDDSGGHSVTVDTDTYVEFFGNSKIFIKTNWLALLIKFFILFFLFEGIILMLSSVVEKVIKKQIARFKQIENPMKKILILNYEFPPLGGGAANATYYLLKEFSKFPDLELDLVTSSVDKFRVEQFSDNIRIHYLDINKKGNLHYQSIKDLLTYSWKAYKYCKELKKKEKFDLIHAFFGIPCGYIAMKLKIPYIISLRGTDVPFHKKRFYWLDKLVFKNLSKKVWKNAKAVISNSKGLKEQAQKTNEKQIIDVICNGVDTDFFCPLLNKQVGNKIKLISVGRLAPEKGYDYLIKAFGGLKDFELTLIGSGKAEEDLKTLANEYKVKVNFLGRQEKEVVKKEFQNSDIYILSSLKEGMSNSMMEGMACGLPVIATNVSGSEELIKGNGFIVEKGDSKAISEKLKVFQDDKNLILTMGKISRDLAEKMSWKNVADEYLNIYNLKP